GVLRLTLVAQSDQNSLLFWSEATSKHLLGVTDFLLIRGQFSRSINNLIRDFPVQGTADKVVHLSIGPLIGVNDLRRFPRSETLLNFLLLSLPLGELLLLLKVGSLRLCVFVTRSPQPAENRLKKC